MIVNLNLDPQFRPAICYLNEFKKNVLKTKNYEKVSITVERFNGLNETYNCVCFNANENKDDDNLFFLERIVKTLLWVYGGYKVIFVGPFNLYERLRDIYLNGERVFDSNFMGKIYDKQFEITYSNKAPNHFKGDQSIGKHLNGMRIGFDAGGSDMKISAVVDGEPIYSDEIVWYPKINSNPEYHRKYIKDAIIMAVKRLPRVDALGISSAGVYVNNQVKAASLFIKVDKEDFDLHVKNIFIDIAKELNVPLEVANDGDVAALAGSMSLGKNKLIGLAMGTSEAVGYVNKDGNITGWLNELAFVPVDFSGVGALDEWSGDIGCGVKYFSQDAVIRLAEIAGIKFDDKLAPAEKLKQVQKMDENSEIYQEIFKTIGIYLGFGLAYYEEFYDIEHVLLMGRVTSYKGGNIIVDYAKRTLKKYFPDLAKKINVILPDEKARRVGQSVAAASLVKI